MGLFIVALVATGYLCLFAILSKRKLRRVHIARWHEGYRDGYAACRAFNRTIGEAGRAFAFWDGYECGLKQPRGKPAKLKLYSSDAPPTLGIYSTQTAPQHVIPGFHWHWIGVASTGKVTAAGKRKRRKR